MQNQIYMYIQYLENLKFFLLNLLQVPSYLGIPWSGSFTLSSDLEEKIITMATEHDTEGGNKQLGLNIKVDRSEICEIIFYAPYWITNKTGLPLQIRVSLNPLLFIPGQPVLGLIGLPSGAEFIYHSMKFCRDCQIY